MCAAFVFILLFIVSTLLKGPNEYTFIVEAGSFFLSANIYLILFRTFFSRIIREANISNEIEIRDRKKFMKVCETAFEYIFGIIFIGMIIYAIIASKPYVFGKSYFLAVTFVIFILFYFSARFISRFLTRKSANLNDDEIENRQILFRIAILIFSILILLCNIIIYITVFIN
jgi:uncharacterized membrane protein YiaA